MNNEEILNVLSTYYELTSLNMVERSGWKEWGVKDTRIESIPEHIFSAQQLAWLIWSEADIDIDILKVICMLSLHETEEVKIGDITPFSGVSEKQKKEMGAEAVKKLFGKLKKCNYLTQLINEFNARQTIEAQFAYLCDKMDCDLRAKRYSDLNKASIESANSHVKNDTQIQEIINNGAKTMIDVFIEFDKGKYKGTVFEELIDFLKNININKL